LSCYFRHLKPLFEEVGIQITPENRKQMDQLIHKIVDVSYKDCPAAWKQIKLGTADPQKKQEFIQKLKSAVQSS
jgi:hypothetical protein